MIQMFPDFNYMTELKSPDTFIPTLPETPQFIPKNYPHQRSPVNGGAEQQHTDRVPQRR
jgi:hypothetical protein